MSTHCVTLFFDWLFCWCLITLSSYRKTQRVVIMQHTQFTIDDRPSCMLFVGSICFFSITLTLNLVEIREITCMRVAYRPMQKASVYVYQQCTNANIEMCVSLDITYIRAHRNPKTLLQFVPNRTFITKCCNTSLFVFL